METALLLENHKSNVKRTLSQNDEEKELIEEEKVKELLNLRSYLEERIRQLEEETEKLKAMFNIVDEVIVTKSFKKAEVIPIAASEPAPIPKFNEEIPLRNSTGTILATIYVGDNEIRLVPTEGLTFMASTPTFRQFFITRILEPMRTKDVEASKEGTLMPNQILSYETVIEDDVIKQVIIKNFGDRNRLREIVSSSRWTLDKMNEKVRTSGSST